MQAACWMGRNPHAALGNVAAHLYAEFDGLSLSLEGLRRALECAYAMHPMLRLRIDEGMQTIAAGPADGLLEVDDLRHLNDQDADRQLLLRRNEWTHQKLDLEGGQVARWCVSLLPGERFRLHVDVDMIAVDPSSFPTLMEDVAGCYEEGATPAAFTPSFFDWHEKSRQDSFFNATRQRDRAWWREKLAGIAPAPSLPFLDPAAQTVSSHRFHTQLSSRERETLQRLAREQRLTLTQLMLGVFAAVLGEGTGDTRWRLNVPTFWRAPLVEQVDRIVGEFANFLILDVETHQGQRLSSLCQQLARQLIERLEHCAYPGVNLMRDLSRHHGSPQLAPVVFTSALDLPEGELFSERVTRALGRMNWVVSQGPQVALDVQVACAYGGILINWDARLDALPKDWVETLFERYVQVLREVVRSAELLDQPLAPAPAEQASAMTRATPLNALQQAYLLGRSAQLPLGGVAMQEFREYQGRIDPGLLRDRLTAMVQRHESLRTLIDSERLVQTVSPQIQVNLVEIDLSAMSQSQASAELDAYRESYSHALFEPHRAPWNVTLFALPGADPVVFVRFDALILDGRSIAALMVELFEGVVQEVEQPSPMSEALADGNPRQDAQAYWRTRLASVTGAPSLPWQVPLERSGAARYRRQTLRVERRDFQSLSQLGARQRLFKNSTIMAVVLEVLSHWVDEGGLCVAVPVAVPASGAFANRSSFLAINWQPGAASFAERAAGLQVDVLEGLQHLAFSGVDIARLLYESHGPGPVLPVVITNGLSWPVSSGNSPVRLTGGLTQTPQVAMDIRFSTDCQGDLVFDIDYVHAVVSASLVDGVLTALDKAIRQMVSTGVFDLEGSSFIDYSHYRFNTDADHGCDEPYLARIASNIFDPGNSRTALISGDRRISYAQLGDAVARVMSAFAARGLQRGNVVGICLPRSPEHTMVTLACALAGIVWVPIDAQAPADRLTYLLANCSPDLVVSRDTTHQGHALITPDELLAGPGGERLASSLEKLSLSESPAYYLYTSGTTGRPKCVVLNNRATANVIASTLGHWSVSADDVFISVTPLHHDMSVFDVLGCLTAGATLVLPVAGEEKDAQRWNELVAQHKVTVWCSVPAILEMLLACRTRHGLRSLRLLAQGGDYIKPAVIEELRDLLPDAQLVSLGGPTETTIWSVWHVITEADRALIPYGRPLPGNRYLVLDEQGGHCPVGVTGRIHTCGVNLALGYLQDSHLVQNDFVTVVDDRGRDVRAFRTGDCAYYRPDGTLIFARRVNGYVKVRGVRVSLPDIEMALIEHPGVQHVLVVDYGREQEGDTSIGALYVGRSTDAPSSAELRDYARQHLAQSHVPTRFVRIAELPLTQNGKPDRARARSLITGPSDAASVLAVTPTSNGSEAGVRSRIMNIYLGVLGRPADGRCDANADFMGLGLRPQHLKTLSQKLNEAFCVDLTPGQILRWKNPQDVETYLQQRLGNQIG